jgi:hypothetical protein
MARNQRLNVRQQQFASAVASGKSFRAAYAETYGTGNSQPQTVARNARRAAGNPKVKERIEALEAELLPGPCDVARLRGHALAVAVDISLHSADDKARLRAAEWLSAQVEEAERRLAQAVVVRPPDPRDEIIDQLRRLYAKALPEREPPPLVEEVVEVATEPESLEMPAPEAPAGNSTADSAYRLVAVPGRHPAEFRRVRVVPEP